MIALFKYQDELHVGTPTDPPYRVFEVSTWSEKPTEIEHGVPNTIFVDDTFVYLEQSVYTKSGYQIPWVPVQWGDFTDGLVDITVDDNYIYQAHGVYQDLDGFIAIELPTDEFSTPDTPTGIPGTVYKVRAE